MPVIVLTASRKDVADMKEAVKAGATNCLTKPVDLELLLDWVRGVANSAGPNVRQPVLEAGPLRMDTQSMRVWFDGAPARLTPTEYRILHYLLVHRERPVSADELVQHNFDGASIKTSNEIPVYISRLRDKLGKATIETVLGYGYRLACGDRDGTAVLAWNPGRPHAGLVAGRDGDRRAGLVGRHPWRHPGALPKKRWTPSCAPSACRSVPRRSAPA